MMRILKNQSMKIDSEVTQIIELAVKKIKTLIINLSHILKKIEESISMLKTDVEKYKRSIFFIAI